MSTNFYKILDLSPAASPDELKAAYHRKLREFPAHSHPQQFKAIREAYESLRKAIRSQSEPFLTVRPLTGTISDSDREDLKKLIDSQVVLNLNTLLKETF